MSDAQVTLEGSFRRCRPQFGFVAWALALLVGACSSPSSNGAKFAPVAGVSADAAVEIPPSKEEPTSGSLAGPPTDLSPPAPGEQRWVGRVIEHLPAGGYHYLRVEPEHGSARWVVTMGGEFAEGSRIEVASLGTRHAFYSRRLDRRFDELLFGMVEVVG